MSLNVLLVISCLEGESKVARAGSAVQKAKFLPAGGGPDALVANDVIIERATIVIVKVNVGRGAAVANISCSYRVVEISQKNLNRWFV